MVKSSKSTPVGDIIESLSKDWLERDGDSFVRIRKTGRLGWEETLAKGTPYSSYLLSSPTMQDLIQRAYPMAKQVISAMDTPFKVNIKLNNDRSCTESKNVYVATNYFDDTSMSVGQKLDIFLGLTAHEGSHLLYTDFPQMGKAAHVHPLCANILNIIEDERIERILGEQKPGLANYLKAVKEYYFGRYASSQESEDESKELPRTLRIVNCILGLIRYPRLLKESEMMEFGEMLLQVKGILTPYPRSTNEAREAAESIYALIKEEYHAKEKSADESSAKSSSKSSSESSESSRSSKKSSTNKEGMESSRRADKRFEDDYRQTSESIKDVAGAPIQPDMGERRYLTDSDISDEVYKDHGILNDICEGKVEIGSTCDVRFLKEPENHDRYKTALSKVCMYIPAVRRVVKGQCNEYKLTHMGMRSGVLDTSKLAEAYQGAPSVYLRHGEVKSDRACVCILIDESGSMIRESRMTEARNAAVLLNEALSGINNVELFIYGHSADESSTGETDIRIYKERDYAPVHALGACEARDNNRDGVAILEVAKRVRKYTKDEVLMFVISDGAPAAREYIGKKAIDHTKQCVEEAEKMGFKIIQICINASYDPALMFKHYLTLENMGTFAKDLGREISKALTSRISSRVVL